MAVGASNQDVLLLILKKGDPKLRIVSRYSCRYLA